MRYITGAFGVIAAAGFVIYSAVTTYHVAYGMTTEFRELAGWAASGIVLWECLGLLYVRQCWQNGSKMLAVGGLALVLAAGVYTVRLDLRFNVAGQSDLVENRKNSAQRLDGVKSELLKARGERDALRKIKRPTGAQSDDLERIEKRISALESKWDTSIVVSTPMPEAGWASRMLRGISSDEGWWTDALMVFGLLFWALARMLALPLAVASMQSAVRKPVQAREALEAVTTPASAFPPVLPRTARLELTPRIDLSRKTSLPALENAKSDLADPSPDKPDGTPPADAAPFEPEADVFRDTPKNPPVVRPVLVDENFQPLTPKQRKQLEKERRQNEAIKAVEEFAAQMLDVNSPGAKLVRTGKQFTTSGGLPGDTIRKAFRQWAKGNRKWRHLASLHDNPLGKAMTVVLETGRPTNGKGMVYAALLRKESQSAIAA